MSFTHEDIQIIRSLLAESEERIETSIESRLTDKIISATSNLEQKLRKEIQQNSAGLNELKIEMKKGFSKLERMIDQVYVDFITQTGDILSDHEKRIHRLEKIS